MGTPISLGLVHAASRQPESNIFADRHHRKQGKLLENHVDRALVGWDSRHRTPADADAALSVRLWDRICDQYVHTPMQQIVADRIHAANGNLDDQRAMLDAGYALLEFLVALVLLLMIVCSFENAVANWLVPGAVSMVYVFMVLFIKDLDNPFGYGDNDGKGSAADVDITYWTNTFKSYQ